MVEFMKKLEDRLYPKWRHAYLNYKMMKKQLKIMASFLAQGESQGDLALTWLKLLFQRTLDSEISKMLDFYKFRAAALVATVDSLENKDLHIIKSIIKQHDVSSRVKMHLLSEYQEKWRGAATKLVRLLDYVSLNMQALRKTVKKQHKIVGTLEPHAHGLDDLRAILVIQHPHEPTKYEQGSYLSEKDVVALASMEQTTELKGVQFKIEHRLAEVKAAVQQMQNVASVATRQRAPPSVSVPSPGGGRVSTDAPPSSNDSPSHVHRRTSMTSAASQGGEDDVESSAIAERTRMLLQQPSFCERMSSEKLPPSKQRSSLGKSLAANAASSATTTTPPALQWPFICIDDGALFTQGHDAEHDQLVQAIVRATDELKRNAKLISPHTNNIGYAVAIFEPAPLKSSGTTLGITVQLVTTFLYMANYNLVIPTVDNFMDHLQIPKTTAGLMIGCADGSAIAIALVYSAWTNRSYRQPILAATVLCCVGNLLVTLAYDTGGLPLLLVGRLVTGAGNARLISRRYMADFFSKDDRDRVSMLFVAASALGMAFGPFITWPLSLVLPRADEGSKVGGFSVNIITAGGWLMVAMWVLFYIFAHSMFDEPLDTGAARGGAAGEPPSAPQGGSQDCTPAQSTDNGTVHAFAAPAKPQSIAVEKSCKDSLGSSRLLAPPPDQKVAVFEGDDVMMPLLPESLPQGSYASSHAFNKLASEDSAQLPATSSGVHQAGGHSPFAGNAVNVAGFQDLGPSDSFASISTARPPPVLAPYATDAEASASAVSFLGRALPPAPGETGWGAVWSRVRGAVGSVHFLPTVTCSMMLFLLKLLQQTTVSAVPVFTGDFYGWHESDVSLFMTAMSLAMFFVTVAATLGNGLVGRRVLLASSLFFCGCGCLLMMDVGDEPISLVRYLTSLSIILAFTNILEGVTMSVMGDVIHPLMAAGFWNAGLMSTQSGSIGRLFGNFSITVFGSWTESTIILGNEMYLALLFCVALCSLLFIASFSRLQKLA